MRLEVEISAEQLERFAMAAAGVYGREDYQWTNTTPNPTTVIWDEPDGDKASNVFLKMLCAGLNVRIMEEKED